jgi:ankyrin repeat protein
MVKCLLAARADADTKYLGNGTSMLAAASAKGFTDIARDLLDAGADLAYKGPDGMTALQSAAKGKHREIVTLLLAKAKELKNANK